MGGLCVVGCPHKILRDAVDIKKTLLSKDSLTLFSIAYSYKIGNQ